MVIKIEEQNKVLYQCEECGHFYETEELAKKCEKWCKEHKSCNLEIIKYAVRVNANDKNDADLREPAFAKASAGKFSTRINADNETRIDANPPSLKLRRASDNANGRESAYAKASADKLTTRIDADKNNIKNFIIGVLVGVLIVGGLLFLKVPAGQKYVADIGGLNARIYADKNGSNQNFNQTLIQQIIEQVLPKEGFKTNLVWKDTIKKMIDCGVIDLEKLNKFYNNQPPEYIQNLISGKSSNEPIVINQETANYLLNLLWPLGLSNKTEFNKNIPFNEKELRYLASTAGWPLSKAENAADYFNKCEILKLTPEQEEIVYRVAQNTFRPCCNNSTFAQDCNHGSALLGALELAVSQGYSEDELYKLALKLNSFWFPDTYAKIALYLKLVENKDWPLTSEDINDNELMQTSHELMRTGHEPMRTNKDDVRDSSRESSQEFASYENSVRNSSRESSQKFALIKEIMSAKYSSISGFIQNVDQKLAKLNLPGIQSSGGGCGLQ